MSDTYATVDKSKKFNKRNEVSCQLPISSDALEDPYTVVDESYKSKPDPASLIKGTYNAVQNEGLDYSSTVAAATDGSATRYDSASAPTLYSQLDHTQVHSAVVNNICSKKQTPAITTQNKSKDRFTEDRYSVNKRKERQIVCMLACFSFLIITVIVTAAAIAMVFVSIASLRSDLTATLEKIENEQLIVKSLESQLNQLNTDFVSYFDTVNNQILLINQNTSRGVTELNQQINSSHEVLIELQEKQYLLKSSMNAVERNISVQLIKISNGIILKSKRINKAVLQKIMNAYEISHATISTLRVAFATGIQILHTFDSCEEVSNFPILLPSGMYNIRSGDSSMNKYCSTTVAFSCNGILGRWKRIAYMSNNTSPVNCPMGFQHINNQVLCKRNPTGARCSSITYSTNGNSYSQVCGTIHGSYFGDPDGFDSHSTIRSRFAITSINNNYVDGISLTHGSINKYHIWTLSAIVNFATNPTDICSVCASNKPSYVGMDYSCDVVDQCKDNCSPRQIWGSGHCIGNNTFYKNLMQPTSDDIDMRVCTDQAENDEDIFLSFIEIYVL